MYSKHFNVALAGWKYVMLLVVLASRACREKGSLLHTGTASMENILDVLKKKKKK